LLLLLKVEHTVLVIPWALVLCLIYTHGITIYVTEFWKITHMGAPETIRIFEFSMVLLIAETTFKNIYKLYL